jgi:hypothetical protein
MQELSERLKVPVIETSAKNSTNVEEAFMQLALQALYVTSYCKNTLFELFVVFFFGCLQEICQGQTTPQSVAACAAAPYFVLSIDTMYVFYNAKFIS